MMEESKLETNVLKEENTTPSQDNTVSEPENKAEFSDVTAVKDGDIVKGKIVKVEDSQVFVDVGYKYDGIIPIRELSFVHLEKAADAVAVGQEVECQVVSIDDEAEKLILSKRAVDREKAWADLKEKFERQDIFEAPVVEVVKGGLVVDVGVRGFVPASMVERHYVEDFSEYKGRTLRLRVKELDAENHKVILSQRDVLEEEFEAKKKQILSNIQVDQILEGTVQRLTSFGAFVDIGGIDGLVHVSEMAWEHVEKPSDVVKEGDTVKVKVLKVDPENERISLSIKATQAGPWENVHEKFKVGDIVPGKVKRLAEFGAFVEIAPGVEGLVHISQIAYRHIATPHEVLKEGQEVNVKILDLKPEDKRVSLSIKETEEPPESFKSGKDVAKEIAHNENVSVNSHGLTLTLGERFGDKLSKLK